MGIIANIRRHFRERKMEDIRLTLTLAKKTAQAYRIYGKILEEYRLAIDEIDKIVSLDNKDRNVLLQTHGGKVLQLARLQRAAKNENKVCKILEKGIGCCDSLLLPISYPPKGSINPILQKLPPDQQEVFRKIEETLYRLYNNQVYFLRLLGDLRISGNQRVETVSKFLAKLKNEYAGKIFKKESDPYIFMEKEESVKTFEVLKKVLPDENFMNKINRYANQCTADLNEFISLAQKHESILQSVMSVAQREKKAREKEERRLGRPDYFKAIDIMAEKLKPAGNAIRSNFNIRLSFYMIGLLGSGNPSLILFFLFFDAFLTTYSKNSKK